MCSGSVEEYIGVRRVMPELKADENLLIEDWEVVWLDRNEVGHECRHGRWTHCRQGMESGGTISRAWHVEGQLPRHGDCMEAQ